MKIAGDIMEAVASEKTISIGPLADNENYTLGLDSGGWFDDEGREVDSLPYKWTSKDGRVRNVYFDTQAHKWFSEDNFTLTPDENVDIHKDFKKEYGLGEEFELLI